MVKYGYNNMSVGLYRHPILGETKKFILNNKHVLSIKTDTKLTQEWAKQYILFKDSFLRNNKMKFYLLPEEVYVDRQVTYEYEQNTKVESMRMIVYQHFVVTLKEELQTRIKGQENFSKKELWFMLYALTCGAIQMLQVRQHTRQIEDIQINPETILLSEYGYIKLIGYFSMPFPIKSQNPYKAPQSNLSSSALPQRVQVTCSALVARIVSSLVLLKQLDQFIEGKQRQFSDQRLLQELKAHEQRLGILYDILRMMLNSNFHERLMVTEVKSMLIPYEDEILALKDFTFDRQVSRESMILLFGGQ